jgi:hypothetical protein
MSNPDLISEIAYFLEDNMVEFLKGATEEELTDFVNTLLPHISPAGVNRIYPIVAESFPPSQTLPLEPDDHRIGLNWGRDNPEKEGTNGD